MENQIENQDNTATTATIPAAETTTDGAEAVITYPTAPDADGWYYENEGQRALEIETRVDDDENIFKRVKLTKRRTAIVRELTKKETKTAATLAKNKEDKVLDAYIALSTVITDETGTKVPFVMEDLENWKGKDTNRLAVACQEINF